VAAALLVLWAASWTLVRAARRWLPSGWPYLWRQGLSNLHRPSNQTVTVVLAIGFGAFLLGTLVLVQFNLLQQLRLAGGPARPNLVLFDIQPDQLSAVRRELREAGLSSAAPVPIVPMRIASIKGRPVRAILSDTSGAGGGAGAWAFRREYRSTYRDTLVASERLEAGEWWPTGRRAGGQAGTRADGHAGRRARGQQRR
jgi:putative ABC transport system permease protein